MTEIVQRDNRVLFFIKAPEVSQIRALIEKYGDRLRFSEGEKPHFYVTLDKNEKAAALMSEVIMLLEASKE